MEQDNLSISWKDLPWQKFQKKSFRLQCKIYKAKQCNNPRLVRRLQKLLIKSKSVYYLAVKNITESLTHKGLFLSEDKKFFLVEQSYYKIGGLVYTPLHLFSKPKNYRGYLSTSLLRNKVFEYVWKFIIEPTSVSNFMNPHKKRHINLNKKLIQEFISLIRSKDQTILKLSINPCWNSIDYNLLISRLWLPLKYKLEMYRVIKKCAVELTIGQKSLMSLLHNNLLDGLEDLNNNHIKRSTSGYYLHKFGFRLDNEVFYFLRKDQNEIYLSNMIRDFLKARGLSMNSTTISIERLQSGFTFSRWYLRYSMDKKISISPQRSYWNTYKRYLIYTLKKEQLNAGLKIKNLKSILVNWIHANNFCSTGKLKSSLFHVKKLLAKHN